jgi:hypothetical protein
MASKYIIQHEFEYIKNTTTRKTIAYKMNIMFLFCHVRTVKDVGLTEVAAALHTERGADAVLVFLEPLRVFPLESILAVQHRKQQVKSINKVQHFCIKEWQRLRRYN